MKWEYAVLDLVEVPKTQEFQLNLVGQEGWELVCVSNGQAYLSREEGTTIRFVEKRDTEAGAELIGHAATCSCGCMAKCAWRLHGEVCVLDGRD